MQYYNKTTESINIIAVFASITIIQNSTLKYEYQFDDHHHINNMYTIIDKILIRYSIRYYTIIRTNNIHWYVIITNITYEKFNISKHITIERTMANYFNTCKVINK